MAFVQSIPTEEQNKLGQQGTTTANPLSLLPPQTGGSSGAAGGGPSASGQGTSTQFGTNASKLGDYLNANQDQVQGMAGSIAGKLNTQFGGLQQGINQAGQQFGSAVNAGYTPTDQALLNQVQQSPESVAGDKGKVDSFQKQLNDQYNGPTSFQNWEPYQQVQQNVQDAVQNASLLGSYPGLSTYLQNNSQGQYTPGQNQLDTSLLVANQPAFQQVQDAAKPFSGLTDYLSKAATTGNDSVAQAQKNAQTAQQAAQQAYQVPASALESSLKDQFGANQKQYTDYNAQVAGLQQALNSPTGASLTPEQDALIGLQPGQFEQLQAINDRGIGLPTFTPSIASNYLFKQVPTAATPTLASSATPEQVARIQALQTLAGSQYNAPFDASQQVSPWSVPTGGGAFDYGSAKTAFMQNLQQADDAARANLNTLYNQDPQVGRQITDIEAFLGNTPDYSTYAPDQLPGGIRLGPPSGSLGPGARA